MNGPESRYRAARMWRLRGRVALLVLVLVAGLATMQPASAQADTRTGTATTQRSAVSPMTPVLKCEKHGDEGWANVIKSRPPMKVMRYDLCLERQGRSLAAGVSINNQSMTNPQGIFGKMIARLMLCNTARTVIAEGEGQYPERAGALPWRVWTKYVYGSTRWYRVQMEVIGDVQADGPYPYDFGFNQVYGRTSKFTSQCIEI